MAVGVHDSDLRAGWQPGDQGRMLALEGASGSPVDAGLSFNPLQQSDPCGISILPSKDEQQIMSVPAATASIAFL